VGSEHSRKEPSRQLIRWLFGTPTHDEAAIYSKITGVLLKSNKTVETKVFLKNILLFDERNRIRETSKIGKFSQLPTGKRVQKYKTKYHIKRIFLS
jgi:hypothetical protein